MPLQLICTAVGQGPSTADTGNDPILYVPREQSMEETAVAALYVYPLKSCKAIQISSAAICPTGFRWDRQWMVVNENGRMLTQRVEPKLALIEPSMPPELLSAPLDTLPQTASLCLNAPGMETLEVPLFGKVAKDKVNVSVWDWAGVALDEGPAAAKWFSRYLGRTCHFVRFDAAVTTRPTETKYADGYLASFSDGFPFLVTSQASLDSLNTRLQNQLPINRFRPNIVVNECEAFAEDLWRSFKIGELTFHGVKLCSRCKVPTINQDTGDVGAEPTLALQAFRKGEMLSTLKSVRHQVFFGQNAVCEESMKSDKHILVHVGDKIRVQELWKELCF